MKTKLSSDIPFDGELVVVDEDDYAATRTSEAFDLALGVLEAAAKDAKTGAEKPAKSGVRKTAAPKKKATASEKKIAASKLNGAASPPAFQTPTLDVEDAPSA